MKPFSFHFFAIFYLCHAYPFSHFFESEFFFFITLHITFLDGLFHF